MIFAIGDKLEYDPYDRLERLVELSPVGRTDIKKNRFDTTQEVRPGPGIFSWSATPMK